MPETTDLNINPYWADYNPLKYYYNILFKPGVSVQVRELNNLQLQIQHQIEQFGDNIFTSGTIVSGCNFQYLNPYPYAQLNDLDAFNNVVVPSAYIGLNATNQDGLTASILNFANGFQSTPPNLKTLYVKYVNTGNTGQNLTSFSVGDTLTIQNPVTTPISQLNVENGGIGFSNANIVIATSVIFVTLNTGSAPSVGTYLSNGNGLTNVQIASITSLPTANQYAIQYQPRSTDLANGQSNSQFWSFSVGDSLTNPSSSLTMTVNQIIGSGFSANVITNGIGTIVQLPINQGGVGYTYLPFITVQSPNNSAGYNTLSLIAQNYVTQVIVASGASTVGNGYAFAISNGVIFQQGYFLQVQPQVIIVDPYSQLPDNVAVGFTSLESIVTYNLDSSLLDNANGQLNYQAPGADRLQLTPQLQVLTAAEVQANSQFLPLVQWNAGNPYLQSQQTIYSTIGNEIAQGIEDTSGDFVLKPFVVTTESSPNTSQMAQYFNVVSDPGVAYINGFKVQTSANYNILDQAGINSIINPNHAISLNYGNYVTIKNIGGYFPYNTAASVNLYNANTGWVPGSSLNSSGSLIGTASIRSMVYSQGTPGTATERRNLYLFNIQMNAGQSFTNVQSVAYNSGSANVGIADVVLVQSQSNVTSNSVTGIANLINTNLDQLVFYSGVPVLKNANNIIYTYRTTNTSVTCSNGNSVNATISINYSSGNETFPYGSGILSQTQLQDFYIVPTGGDMIYTSNVDGSVSGSSANAQVNGSSTSFVSQLTVGQWVYYVGNSAQGHSLLQVNSIINATALTFTTAPGFTNTTAVIYRCYPNNVPVPFGFAQSDLTGNVNSSENIITLSFGNSFQFSGSLTMAAGYNVSRSNYPTQITKTANRNYYVSLCTSNNAGGQSGPWCLGIPDIFRLRGVYLGNSSVTNTGINYVSSFFVDAGQNPDFYNLSSLYIQPQANGNLPITANSYILVNFDYFTGGTGGFYDTVSYVQTAVANTLFVQDSQSLSSLSSQTFCNSWEVPELFLDDGSEVDLLGYFDFRPYAANTVTPSQTSTGLPGLNPANTLTLATSGEHKFPLPSSILTATIEGWTGRINSLYVDQNGSFTIGTGGSVANLSLALAPAQPIGTMKIVDMVIPPYPAMVANPDTQLQQILNTSVITNGHTTSRQKNQLVYNLSANSSLPYNQPQVYTQAQIGALAAQIQQLFAEVSLNALEANSAAQLIPSSANNGLNRTSYGIFTDNFTTSDFSNLVDPAYAAIKQGPNIVPDKFSWDMQLFGNASVPYINFPIVRQDNATVGGITDPLGLGPRCALNLANTVAYELAFRNASDSSGLVDTVQLQFANSAEVLGSLVVSNGTITQSVLSGQYQSFSEINVSGGLANLGPINGPGNLLNYLLNNAGSALYAQGSYNAATQTITFVNSWGYTENVITTIVGIPPNIGNLFVQALNGQITWQQFVGSLNTTSSVPAGGSFIASQYNPPVAFYFYNYAQQAAYNIYQNGTLIGSSDPSLAVATCQDLTAADITMLEGSAAENWFNDNPQLYMQNFVQGNGGYVSYAGKILFNYNPTLGSNFTIVSTSTPSTTMWRWVLAYPINGSAIGCVPPTPTTSISGTVNPVYSTYDFNAHCGNGLASSGQISILTGFTTTWNGTAPVTPTTSIVSFDSSQDWQS